MVGTDRDIINSLRMANFNQLGVSYDGRQYHAKDGQVVDRVTDVAAGKPSTGYKSRAMARGTDAHNMIERYITSVEIDPHLSTVEQEWCDVAVEAIGLGMVVETEVLVSGKVGGQSIAGRLDALLLDGNSVVVVDWKTGYTKGTRRKLRTSDRYLSTAP